MRRSWPIVLTISACQAACAAADVTLVEQGTPSAVIVVDRQVMAPNIEVNQQTPYARHEAEMGRRRVRESVKDLVHYLGRMSEATFQIVRRNWKIA